MTKYNKLLSVLLAVLLLIPNLSVVLARTADYSNNWASKEINKWLSFGVVQTNDKGDFKPSEPIKRIDMAIMLNKLFNYQEKSGTKFSDITADASFAADVAKAVAAGNFTGNGGKFRPNDSITRQEAAIVFARAFSLSASGKNVLTKFKDMDKIAAWSKDAVNSMVGSGYMNGVPGNLFAPGDGITRAEAVKIVDNMAKDLKSKSGTYTGDVDGNLVVNTKDVILKNMTIKGDLFLTEGIGNGEVTLNNVKIAGKMVVKGGGENSVVLNNTSVSGSLIILKKDGKIRVVASGSSEISKIILNSGVKLEESNLTGKGFGDVDIIQVAPGQQITLDGDFASLNIEADGVRANIPDGSVGTINIKKGTTGSKLNIGNTASVKNLIANDDVIVTGGSRIQNADINSNGVVFDTKPVNINIAPNTTVTVAGKSITATPPAAPTTAAAVIIPPVVPPVTPPAGGGGGGDNGGGPPSITLSASSRSIFLYGTTASSITVNPSDAILSYSSNNPSVVSVNTTSGALTGVSTGSAVITVTAAKLGYNTATATFNVTVIQDNITITVSDRAMVLFSTTSSSVSVNPSDAILSYSSSNPSAVSVNTTSGAMSTLFTTGSAVITVTATKPGYNDATATFNVTTFEGTITVSAKDKEILLYSTTASAVTVNPSDAILSYSSNNPSVVSANSSGVLTGVSTGSAIITVSAFKLGYKRETITFNVNVVEDTTLPTVTASVGERNKITLTFSKPVLKAGRMRVYKSDGYTQLGNEINLVQENPEVEWESSTVVKVANTAGSTGLDNTDAAVFKVKITDVRDAAESAKKMYDTVLTLQSADTKAPRILAYYTAKAGSTAADDTITFYFSEAMKTETLRELENYTITTPAGATYTERKALSEYSDVSIDSIASDSKSVAIRIKNGKDAADKGLAFQVSNIKDVAGNSMATTTGVSLYYELGPYVTATRAIAVNKIEIEFNQEIGTCAPNTFILRNGPSSTSNIAAAVISMQLDGTKVTATLDRDLTTDFKDIYLDVLNSNLTKNKFAVELTTAAGILASGPVAIPDKVKAVVKAFTATTGGIIIEFSEMMTTEVQRFAEELALFKLSDPVFIDAASIFAIDGGDLATGFKKLLISGLEANKDYTIQLIPRGITRDKSEYQNWFVKSDERAVTTK